MFLTDDYFSDVNPRQMRAVRLMEGQRKYKQILEGKAKCRLQRMVQKLVLSMESLTYHQRHEGDPCRPARIIIIWILCLSRKTTCSPFLLRSLCSFERAGEEHELLVGHKAVRGKQEISNGLVQRFCR